MKNNNFVQNSFEIKKKYFISIYLRFIFLCNDDFTE